MICKRDFSKFHFRGCVSLCLSFERSDKNQSAGCETMNRGRILPTSFLQLPHSSVWLCLILTKPQPELEVFICSLFAPVIPPLLDPLHFHFFPLQHDWNKAQAVGWASFFSPPNLKSFWLRVGGLARILKLINNVVVGSNEPCFADGERFCLSYLFFFFILFPTSWNKLLFLISKSCSVIEAAASPVDATWSHNNRLHVRSQNHFDIGKNKLLPKSETAVILWRTLDWVKADAFRTFFFLSRGNNGTHLEAANWSTLQKRQHLRPLSKGQWNAKKEKKERCFVFDPVCWRWLHNQHFLSSSGTQIKTATFQVPQEE